MRNKAEGLVKRAHRHFYSLLCRGLAFSNENDAARTTSWNELYESCVLLRHQDHPRVLSKCNSDKLFYEKSLCADLTLGGRLIALDIRGRWLEVDNDVTYQIGQMNSFVREMLLDKDVDVSPKNLYHVVLVAAQLKNVPLLTSLHSYCSDRAHPMKLAVLNGLVEVR